MVADALSQKRNEDPHQQMARLWTMIKEIIVTNLVLQPSGFLANLVISNDLIEKAKMTQIDDKELNTFMDKSTNVNVDDVGIV